MPLDLIIDGYNLLHTAGLARATYGPGGLERARERLLKRIAKGLTDAETTRTTVVFDAQDVPPGGTRHQLFRGLYLVYSPHGKEADDVIEEFIEDHSAPKQLVVVSSDNRLIRAAQRRKATAILSDAFLAELTHRAAALTGESANTPEKPELELTEEEVTQWLDQFNDLESLGEFVEPLKPPRHPPGRTTPAPPEPSGQPQDLHRSKREKKPTKLPPPAPIAPRQESLSATSDPDNVSLIAELEAELRRLLAEDD